MLAEEGVNGEVDPSFNQIQQIYLYGMKIEGKEESSVLRVQQVFTYNHLTCPLAVVKTFLTDDIIRQIVEHTNSYADVIKNTPRIVERVNHTKHSIFQLWKNVDEDEIWLYICITLLMGIIHKPMYHMYWTTDCIFSTPIFSRLMRRDRFEQIRSMIHFVDPLQEDPTDSLRELSSYIEQLQETFCTNYNI